MSSLLDGIDTGPEKPAKGGYRSAPDDEGEGASQKKKLIIALILLTIGGGLIVWNMTSGVKSGTLLAPSPPDSSASSEPSVPKTPAPSTRSGPASAPGLGGNTAPPPKTGPAIGVN